MRRIHLFNYLALSCFILSAFGLQAQFLSWEYESLLTDTQQSGANPDMHIDAAGNVHVSSWREENNQLAYSFRNKLTGNWTYEVLDASNQAGYKSAIVVDDAGTIHIAYLIKRGNDAFLKYVYNSGGNWQYEETLANEALGAYGPSLDFPVYPQASIDISIQNNGQALISVFDASFNNIVVCEGQSIYLNYDLKLRVVAQMPDGSWQELALPPIPFQGSDNCLRTGDRYGEFCKNFQGADGRSYVLTNSVHNHQVLLFYSDPENLLSWNYSVIDSLQRLGSVGSTQFRQTFDFIDLAHSSDSLLHLIYGVSDLYGYNNTAPPTQRTFFYTRFNIDSLNQPAYAPFRTEFVNPRDGLVRSNYAISSLDDQRLLVAYYDVDNAAALVKISANGGQSWSTDTLLHIITNTPLQTAAYQDSLYVLLYDAEKDYQILASKAFTDTKWQYRAASITEDRAQAFSSQVVRVNDTRDDIYMAFNERWRDQLYFGERIDGSWNYETIDQPNQVIEEVQLGLNAQAEVCLAYVSKATEQLKLAAKPGNVWQTQTIDASSKARDISLAIGNDSMYISYFDLKTGDLKLASARWGTNTWRVQVLDNSSLIVGPESSLHIDQAGNLHIGYTDVINQRLKYAFKALNGSWQISYASAPFEVQPEQIQLLTDSLNTPVIAFRDASLNRIIYAEYQQNEWRLSIAKGDEVNFIANPLRLILDKKDRPWIAHNFSGIFDDLRLLRRDQANSWQEVSVINNIGMIANSFDFHLTGQDFYLLGKKNRLKDNGIALLYARKGVTTDIDENQEVSDFDCKLFPNPAYGALQVVFDLKQAQALSISLFDLQGKLIKQVAGKQMFGVGKHQLSIDLSQLNPGIYLMRLQNAAQYQVKKVVLIK